jgi:hypothetical protein
MWANQALVNSEIDENTLIFKYAGFRSVDFTEENGQNINFEILRLINEFSDLRDSLFADIVMAFTLGEYTSTNQDAVESRVLGSVLVTGVFNEISYGIIEALPRSLDNHVFVHEMGHLFGCRHQPSQDTTSTFAKAHFFRRCFLCKRHRTIMHTPTLESFFGGNSRLVQHFSNPDVNYFPNRATGVENERDNARQLSDVACTLSQFQVDPFDEALKVMMYRSNECVAPNSKMLVTTQVEGGDSITSYEWRWSFDGINYSPTLGTNSSFLVSLQSFEHTLFVQVTVSSSDGQVTVGTIFINVNQHCPYIDESPRLSENEKSSKITLYPPLPNPTRDNFSITLSVKESQHIILTVNDAYGTLISTIYNGDISSGLRTFDVNIANRNQGIFYINLRSPSSNQSQRILMMK